MFDLDARFEILAVVLFEHFRRGQEMHTRLPEHVIPNKWIIVGRSVKAVRGRVHHEHVVPLAFLWKRAKEMFGAGKGLRDVERFLRDNLQVVIISEEEAEELDGNAGLKTNMPNAWDGKDPYARLRTCGIQWIETRKKAA